MSSEDSFREAIDAVRLGEQDRARRLFQEITRQEPDNFQAWLWLSELAGVLEEQTAALERAEALCPENTYGRHDLQAQLNAMRSAVPQMAAASAEPVPAGIHASVRSVPTLDDLSTLRAARSHSLADRSRSAWNKIRALMPALNRSRSPSS